MRTVELRSDTSRYVLLLENPAKMYQTRLDGSIRSRLTTQIEQFLTAQTPESALQDVDKFPAPLRQLKDRGGKVRALGTWCSGDGFDLLVVQIIYDKDDESKYLPKCQEFARRGTALQERFEATSLETLWEKVAEWNDRADFVVFSRE